MPASFSDDGWAQVQVDIAVQCFHGSIQPYLERTDLQRFAEDLTALHSSLAGRAELAPTEGQFSVVITGNGRGSLAVSGYALARASYDSKLQFQFELDQTFLPPVLAELEALLANGERASA
jgi:hypothetical protein